MDPDTCFATLIDTSAERDDRIQAGADLDGWLATGGYVPAALGDLASELLPFAIPKGARTYVAGYLASLLIEQAIAKSNG